MQHIRYLARSMYRVYREHLGGRARARTHGPAQLRCTEAGGASNALIRPAAGAVRVVGRVTVFSNSYVRRACGGARSTSRRAAHRHRHVHRRRRAHTGAATSRQARRRCPAPGGKLPEVVTVAAASLSQAPASVVQLIVDSPPHQLPQPEGSRVASRPHLLLGGTDRWPRALWRTVT